MKYSYNIERFTVKNGLFKQGYIFRVYKNVFSKHAIGCKKLFEGSYKECLKFVSDNNITLKVVFEV